jgi:actin related protein 2/3 complex subunit 2
MGIQCWSDLVKYGADDTLKREYGDWVVGTEQEGKEPEYDVTLIIDLEKIPEDEGAFYRRTMHDA